MKKKKVNKIKKTTKKSKGKIIKKIITKKPIKNINIKKEAPQNWKEFENEENKFEKYFKENI